MRKVRDEGAEDDTAEAAAPGGGEALEAGGEAGRVSKVGTVASGQHDEAPGGCRGLRSTNRVQSTHQETGREVGPRTTASGGR
ncbi:MULTISPECIES: hypothetical protein [Streptomyces violaceusniger group]|uniref:Uncharacterized protein n=2 Tax=Streptomyces rhizosphaericus TaxID=114699 RepID=A0ABN1SDH2_9ACTN|nr:MULTISPECIES: hypothetical protein [Streptomyces violaceusniger group]